MNKLKFLMLSLIDKLNSFNGKSRGEKMVLLRRCVAVFMLGIILFESVHWHINSVYAEDSPSNYSVTLAWRNEKGEWYDNDVAQQLNKNLDETESSKELNIVMNIQVKNSNLNPVLYPGEIRIKFNNLDGLKRDDANYRFEMNDPIFSNVWDAQWNESEQCYYIVNTKPITDKAANTTIHWTVAARDAVGYIEEEDGGPYTKTIEAEYSIVRLLRNDEGELLAFNDSTDFLLEENGNGGYYAKNEDDFYVSSYTDENNYSLIVGDKIRVHNTELETALKLSSGEFIDQGVDENTFILEDGDKVIKKTDSGYLYLSAYGDNIYINGDGILVDENGNFVNSDGTAVEIGVPVGANDSAYATNTYKTATDADRLTDGLQPIKIVDTENSPVQTNSINFSYQSEPDDFTQTITANGNPNLFESLPNGYWYNQYTVQVVQTKQTRGLAESDYFVGIPVDSLDGGLTVDDFANGNLVFYDANNNKISFSRTTVDGRDYYGYYVHKNKQGDLNNDKASAVFTVGISKSKIDDGTETKKLNVEGVFTPFYNDESKPDPAMREYKPVSIEPTATPSTDNTSIDIKPSAEREIKPSDLGLSKSSPYENGNHTKPSEKSKMLLTGLLFQNSNITFNIYPTVKKSQTDAPMGSFSASSLENSLMAFSAEPYFEDIQWEPLKEKYNLYVGDDALSVRYMDYTDPDNPVEKYCLLDASDYDITSVVIPKGIYKYNDAGIKTGYPYKLYTGTRNGNDITWDSEYAHSGTTEPNSEITVPVNADAFYIVIEDLDIVINGKNFKVNANMSLDSQKDEYKWLMGASTHFGDSDARVVNYAFSQVVYDKDGNEYDLAAQSAAPTLDSGVYTDNDLCSDINALLSSEDSEFLGDTSNGYLKRVYSNAYLRTSLATLTSTTRYWYDTYKKPGIQSVIDEDAWLNKATTTGTIISENPGQLNKFSLHVQIPENTQLVLADSNFDALLNMAESNLTSEEKAAGEAAYSKLVFDAEAASQLLRYIEFSGTDYYSAVDNSMETIKLTADFLNTYNTKISYDTEKRLLSVSFRFDLQNTPLYEADLTSVSFTYGLKHIEEKAYNDSKVYVTSYTVLSDLGQDIRVTEGSAPKDTSDLDKNEITDQTIARSSKPANLKFLDQYKTLNNRKYVKTYFSGSRYVTSSRAMAMPHDIAVGENVPESSEYSYRLEVFKAHDGNNVDKLQPLIIYDEIEQYKGGSDTASGSSQWQGTFQYIGTGSGDSNIADYGLTPVFLYTTTNPNLDNTFVTPTTGSPIPNVDFSNYLRDLHDNYENPEALETKGWMRGTIDSNGNCHVGDGDTPYAVAVILLPSENSTISAPTNFYITMYMQTPVGTESNINTRTVNRFFVEDRDNALTVGGTSLNDSDVVKVLLMNTVKIRKVDYDDNSMALSSYTDEDGVVHGAKFSLYKFTDPVTKETAPSTITGTYRAATYQADNGTSYETKELYLTPVDMHGELELPVPAGTYILYESESPENYAKDPYYYLINFNDAGQASIWGIYEGMGIEGQSTDFLYRELLCSQGISKVSASDEGYDEKNIAKMTEDNTIISIRNKANAKASILFKKKDSTTGLPLQGVKFELYKADLAADINELSGDELETAIESSYTKVNLRHSTDVDYPYDYTYITEDSDDVLTTDKDGVMIVRELPPGNYAIKEIESKTGYKTDSRYHPFQIRFVNTRVLDDPGEEGSADRELWDKFYCEDASERWWFTSTEEEVTNEETGETEPVIKYNYDYDLTNDQILSSIRLRKTDQQTGNGLKNARYRIYRFVYDGDDASITPKSTVGAFIRDGASSYWEPYGTEKTTPASGVVFFDNLPFGSYIIREVSAPIGYVRSDDFKADGDWYKDKIITITPELAVSCYNAETGETTPLNMTQEDERKTGKLTIVKSDAQDTEKGINGAQFKVFSPTDALDSDYTALLQTGETPAEGVKDENGNTTFKVSTADSPNKAVLIYDTDKGAYRRYNELEGESGSVFVTQHNAQYGKDGYTAEITGLPWGVTYCVYELTPPSGYKVSAPEMVPLTKNHVDNTLYVDAYDERVRGKVTLTKTGEGSVTQAGAQFELYFKAQGESEYTRCNVTGSNGVYVYADTTSPATKTTLDVTADMPNTVKVSNLPWGSYYFKETKAPEGFALAADVPFAVSQYSCSTDQQIKCKNETAKAKIIIDKEVDVDPTVFANAFGYPTFIFKIEEVDGLNGSVKADGKTYMTFMTFDREGVTRQSTSVDVDQGVYRITEVKVSRYGLTGANTLTSSSTPTGETNIDSSKYNITSSYVGYCDLVDDRSGFLPTYEIEFKNKLSRYDELSHTGKANNLFPSTDYITGFSVNYDQIIPVNSSPGTKTIYKSELTGKWIYASGKEEDMTTEEKNKLVITTAAGGVEVTNGGSGSTSFTVANTTGLSASSSMADVKVNKVDFEGKDLAADLDFTMFLNYGAYKPDRIARVTLLPDLDEHVSINKANGEAVGNVALTFKQPYDNASSKYSTSELSYVDGLAKYTDYTYNGVEDRDTKKNYKFDHWYLLDEDNNPVRKTEDTEEAARFTGVSGYSTAEVGTIIPFTGEDEIKAYVKINAGSKFTFRAEAVEVQKPTAMLVPANIDLNGVPVPKNILKWNGGTDDINAIYSSEFISDNWEVGGSFNKLNEFNSNNPGAITGDNKKIRITKVVSSTKTEFENAFSNGSEIYDVSVRFNNSTTTQGLSSNDADNINLDYYMPIFAWREPVNAAKYEYALKMYTPSPLGLYTSDYSGCTVSFSSYANRYRTVTSNGNTVKEDWSYALTNNDINGSAIGGACSYFSGWTALGKNLDTDTIGALEDWDVSLSATLDHLFFKCIRLGGDLYSGVPNDSNIKNPYVLEPISGWQPKNVTCFDYAFDTYISNSGYKASVKNLHLSQINDWADCITRPSSGSMAIHYMWQGTAVFGKSDKPNDITETYNRVKSSLGEWTDNSNFAFGYNKESNNKDETLKNGHFTLTWYS